MIARDAVVRPGCVLGLRCGLPPWIKRIFLTDGAVPIGISGNPTQKKTNMMNDRA